MGGYIIANAGGETTGEALYTTPGTFTWTAPAGVTSVSVVAVGSAGGHASAVSNYGSPMKYSDVNGECGGAGYKNAITVVPGNGYTVVVGDCPSTADGTTTSNISTARGKDGQDSYFISGSTVAGHGGDGAYAKVTWSTGSTSGTAPGAGEGTYVGDGGKLGIDGSGSQLGYELTDLSDYGISSDPGGNYKDGAVRIVWGTNVAFPNTNTETKT